MLLILHLACADFFMATFGIIFPLISAVRRTWIFGSVMCEIYAFVMAIGGKHLLQFPVIANLNSFCHNHRDSYGLYISSVVFRSSAHGPTINLEFMDATRAFNHTLHLGILFPCNQSAAIRLG